MGFINDVAEILRSGISIDELKELANINKGPEDKKDPDNKGPEDKKDPDNKGPEDKKDPDNNGPEDKKDPEEDKDYKKLYEDTKKELQALQKKNSQKDIGNNDTKSNADILKEMAKKVVF